MQVIYSFAIQVYTFLIRLYAPFHPKAALWINGRKGLFETIKEKVKNVSSKKIWIHCASLGEYEQAVPLLEKLKGKFPDHSIILTFFSPSGYELKKNSALADAVFYLPVDSRKNAKQFLELVNPAMAFFIKYEFWHYYISELYKRHIPLYFISARFRKRDLFFRWYGTFFLSMLKKAKHIFVQDEESLQHCINAGIKNCSVSGDTRYDRVSEIAKHPKTYKEIEAFCSGKKVFIAGSTWPEDEKLICELVNDCGNDWKFILAPHEISEAHIHQLISGIKKSVLRYSQLNGAEGEVLILDNVGMLSSVYQYGLVAYVGGGFGRGLHNILEPAAFGLPVIFGNHFTKNPEAVNMLANGTGFSVSTPGELKNVFKKLISSETRLAELQSAQKNFIKSHAGAVNKIMNGLS